MDHVGKTYLFDCGEVILKVKYLSDRKLAWEQIKGPDAGSHAQEDYGFTAIRPAVYSMWWQEKDRAVATQVVDFEKKIVNTVYVTPEQKVVAFQGTIRPSDS